MTGRCAQERTRDLALAHGPAIAIVSATMAPFGALRRAMKGAPLSARTHRQALGRWFMRTPLRVPRWYWFVAIPVAAVLLALVVWSFLTLGDPPAWISPTTAVLSWILWPLIASGWVYSYVVEYREVRDEAAGQSQAAQS